MSIRQSERGTLGRDVAPRFNFGRILPEVIRRPGRHARHQHAPHRVTHRGYPLGPRDRRDVPSRARKILAEVGVEIEISPRGHVLPRHLRLWIRPLRRFRPPRPAEPDAAGFHDPRVVPAIGQVPRQRVSLRHVEGVRVRSAPWHHHNRRKVSVPPRRRVVKVAIVPRRVHRRDGHGGYRARLLRPPCAALLGPVPEQGDGPAAVLERQKVRLVGAQLHLPPHLVRQCRDRERRRLGSRGALRLGSFRVRRDP